MTATRRTIAAFVIMTAVIVLLAVVYGANTIPSVLGGPCTGKGAWVGATMAPDGQMYVVCASDGAP